MVNEAERRRWNDELMVSLWPKRERFTDQVIPHVLKALQPVAGEKVLDIGAGGGRLSLAVAERVMPGGSVVGADISEGMVKLATGRMADAGAKGVSFVAADMQVEEAPGGPFDAACSQFGVMFFDEPVAAFANIRRQLKKGGRIAFACWQGPAQNAWFPGPAIGAFVSPPRPPSPGKAQTGPFALGDPRRTRGILERAGFADVTRTPRRMTLWSPADAVADEGALSGVPKERRPEAAAALSAHFARFPRRGDGLIRFELNFQLFTARLPA